MQKESFSAKVLFHARKIPKGKVSTYKKLASLSKNPKASRAVGTIMHNNDQTKTGVCCHRVVKSNGEVGGYAHGRRKKISILKSEGVEVVGGKVDLIKYGFP